MKKLVLLSTVIAMMGGSYAFADIQWNGGIGTRFDEKYMDDSLNTKDAHGADMSHRTQKSWQSRVNLGATGGWDNVDWAMGIRSNITGATINSSWTTWQDGAASGATLGFEEAWARYSNDWGFGDISVKIGQQRPVFAYDSNSENFMDNDTRFGGFGWAWTWGSFGLNAAQYILGARNSTINNASSTNAVVGATTTTSNDSVDSDQNKQASFGVLYAFQPTINWRFNDTVDMMAAVGYYDWNRTKGYYTNMVKGGTGGRGASANSDAVPINNARQWQFLTKFTLPYKLGLNFEYVMNRAAKYYLYTNSDNTKELGRSAWVLGLTYGKMKKAHDFMVSYSYGEKALGSVINRYTYDKFPADNNGHIITAGYNLADNFSLNARAVLLQEKGLMTKEGLAETSGEDNKSNEWVFSADLKF